MYVKITTPLGEATEGDNFILTVINHTTTSPKGVVIIANQ